MDQASAVQMNIVCNANEQAHVGHYFLQVDDVLGDLSIWLHHLSNNRPLWDTSL